ncbi:MAG: DUF4936 family protein [Burkholderiaceae bacterium]
MDSPAPGTRDRDAEVSVFVYFKADAGERERIGAALAALAAESRRAPVVDAGFALRRDSPPLASGVGPVGARPQDTWLEHYRLRAGSDVDAWLATLDAQARRHGLISSATGARHVERFVWLDGSVFPCA